MTISSKPKRVKIFHSDLTITAVFKGNRKKARSSVENWNNHRILMRNNKTKQQSSFDFWGSIEHPEIKSKKRLLKVFIRFVSHAISGEYDLYEFCNKSGYGDADIGKAHRVWRMCQRHNAKLKKVYDGDMRDLLNDLKQMEVQNNAGS